MNELILIEWAQMAIRWLHVVAGIAWIGSSFYFVHLDLSLKRAADSADGTQGEAWQVHGGGFYHMVKYLVAPARMPSELTWFKWEAYATWLSGFALLAVVYYLGADLFLVDHDGLDLLPWQAVLISIAGLVLPWLGYEAICRSPIGKQENALAGLLYVMLVALALLFAFLFNGRGAFIQIGALIGTMMVANVFAVIIPNQRKVVASLLAGQAPDPSLGKQAKQRSVHNNYLTLPVVFVMISNHYPLLYGTRFNWLIIAIVLLLGPLIRHFFNARHAGKPSPWWTWGVAALGMIAIAFLSAQGPRHAQTTGSLPTPTNFAAVEEIVNGRCAMCHSAEPVWDGIAVAPKGVQLDSPQAILRNAGQIGIAAAHSSAMPPGNITSISSEERQILATWISAGATSR